MRMENEQLIDGLIMKYFVLNPGKNNKYGVASRRAILEYADAIREENPALANDLDSWVALEERKCQAQNFDKGER